MKRRLLWVILLPLLLVLSAPTDSRADAAVVQDSCQVFEQGGLTFVRIYFTIVNFSLPAPVCDLHFIPEPLPVWPECEILECGAPMGWSCFLNPLGGADWFANTLNDCIPQMDSKGEFSFLLDPGFCCYVTQFTDPTGAVMLEQEECFTLCGKVPIEDSTWGALKQRYR